MVPVPEPVMTVSARSDGAMSETLPGRPATRDSDRALAAAHTAPVAGSALGECRRRGQRGCGHQRTKTVLTIVALLTSRLRPVAMGEVCALLPTPSSAESGFLR